MLIPIAGTLSARLDVAMVMTPTGSASLPHLFAAGQELFQQRFSQLWAAQTVTPAPWHRRDGVVSVSSPRQIAARTAASYGPCSTA